MTAKQDNSNLAAKLMLRRHFLEAYHADGSANVLDCCQGNGVLWARLRNEFRTAGYWGLDVKPSKGRLKLASERVLAQPGWPQNVVDIDTYGSPWALWLAMLPNVTKDTTVFLTVGRRGIANKNLTPKSLTDDEAKAIGFGIDLYRLGGKQLQTYFGSKIAALADAYLLARLFEHDLEAVEAVEVVGGTATRYIGIRLKYTRKVDRMTNGQGADNAMPILSTTTLGGNGHV